MTASVVLSTERPESVTIDSGGIAETTIRLLLVPALVVGKRRGFVVVGLGMEITDIDNAISLLVLLLSGVEEERKCEVRKQ